MNGPIVTDTVYDESLYPRTRPRIGRHRERCSCSRCRPGNHPLAKSAYRHESAGSTPPTLDWEAAAAYAPRGFDLEAIQGARLGYAPLRLDGSAAADGDYVLLSAPPLYERGGWVRICTDTMWHDTRASGLITYAGFQLHRVKVTRPWGKEGLVEFRLLPLGAATLGERGVTHRSRMYTLDGCMRPKYPAEVTA